ncbi:RacO protein OS=Streptomyces fumanus OX=67302 GN=GCM10018772_61460 PE=4 SV=1 [Streptomyces fumanus]
MRAVIIVSDRIGNVTRTRYEQLVAEARDLINQMAKAQFALGDKALEIEPMRPVGGSMPNGTDDLFTVEESLQLFADDIGVARSTVEDWRWTASRWPEAKRKDGVSFTVHKILASIQDEDERWAAIEDAPFNSRSGKRQWTPDAAKRLVGQRVDWPVTVEEKVQAVTDLTRDEEVASRVTVDLLARPATAAQITPDDRVRVVRELTRDDDVAKQVTTDLLKRPAVARETMRDDTARFLVNRAQFDNSAQVRETIRERTPAVRKIEHTIEYLDLVGSCHQFVATLGRLVPRMRGQEFSEDERETVRRGISKVRAAADWLEAAVDNGEFTLDEQLAQLLKGE